MKLIEYSFYHKDTGAIHPTRFATTVPRSVAANTPADHIAIPGVLDHETMRVDVKTRAIIQQSKPSPAPTVDVARERAQAQIQALEAKQARAMREFAIGIEGAADRLRSIDNEITELRKKL